VAEVVPIKKATPQAPDVDPNLNIEMGVERILPFSFWGTEGEISNNNKIPIDDLVEMRRRDGQARALMRLFVLPILSAMADGEWIAPDTDEDEVEESPDAVKVDKSEKGVSEKPGEKVAKDPKQQPADDTKLEAPDDDPEDAENAEDAEEDEKEKPKGKAPDPEVDFANLMWNLPPQAGGMTTSKTTVLKKHLQALMDGFAVFEEVRHVPEDGPLKGKITLRKLAYRDPRTVRFRVDDTGGFNGVRQVASINGKTIDVKIPKEKVFYWACHEEENPYYGVSMFEAAYHHYEVKRKLYYIAHLAAQFAAVPGRVGTVPKGADPRHVTAFKQSLMNFAFNTAMVAPEGFVVTPFNGNANFDFIKLIDHHNHMMSKSVLSSFLDSENRTTLIEVGVTDPNTDFFVMALESLMDDLAEHWSMYLMPKYIDWNFGSKRYPIFKFGQLSDAAKDTIKEIFTAVVSSSVLNSTPEFVRELEKKLAKSLDLDIDYEEIEEQEQAAAQEEADAAEDEANNLLAPDGGANPAPPKFPGDGGGPQPPPAPGSAQPAGPKGPVSEPPVGLTNPTIDDLVAAAVELFAERPEGEVEEV
jgi:hypothetical protein